MTTSRNIAAAKTVRLSVIRKGLQEEFAARLRWAGSYAQKVIIVSPWISQGRHAEGNVTAIANVIKRRGIPTYVITRPPASELQQSALDILSNCPSAEIVYNGSLHAKIYASIAPHPHGFAMIGSANLTEHSESLYEIGLLVQSGGGGDEIIGELTQFCLSYLRTRPDSRLIKSLIPPR